jgi:hypothetical protein
MIQDRNIEKPLFQREEPACRSVHSIIGAMQNLRSNFIGLSFAPEAEASNSRA